MKGADSIELKLTLPEHSYRSTTTALGVDPLDAQIRQVFFFDTPDLVSTSRCRRQGATRAGSRRRLGGQAAPGRPRRVAGPVAQAARVRRRGRRAPRRVRVLGVAQGTPTADVGSHDRGGQTTAAQGVLQGPTVVLRRTRAGPVDFDELAVLGPIFVLKLELAPRTFGRRIVGEMWLYPDGSRLVELSTKCLPGEGLDVAEQLLGFLASKDISTEGEQQTKTKIALEFFSAELHSR